MESDAILKMVEYAFRHHCFIIYAIISDCDSEMQAVLKHSPRGSHGQVIKSSKGKIYEEIPVSSFLPDPFHHVKFAAKHIFSVVNDSKDQRCRCTKVDDLRINKNWGYMIKQ